MTVTEVKELRYLIIEINTINDFDLNWRWHGSDDTPVIEIYEEADRHVLCTGTLETIKQQLLDSLPSWGLTYPRDPLGRMKT